MSKTSLANEPLVPSHRNSRRFFQTPLATLLLVIAAAAAAISYYSARTTLAKTQLRLNALRAAAGMPPIRDVSQVELTPASSFETGEWFLWVPQGRTINICWSTAGGEEPFPAEHDAVTAEPGRHRLVFDLSHAPNDAQLLVDSRPAFQLGEKPGWRLSPPWDSELNQPVTLGNKPIALLSAFGSAKLKAGEAYDPARHRYRLRVWVAP